MESAGVDVAPKAGNIVRDVQHLLLPPLGVLCSW